MTFYYIHTYATATTATATAATPATATAATVLEGVDEEVGGACSLVRPGAWSQWALGLRGSGWQGGRA